MDKEKEELLNNILWIAKNEVRQEVIEEENDRKERKILYNKQAKELYDKYNFKNPIVLKYLKKNLPLNVRLLNKITVVGQALLYDNIIQYTYYFNNDYTHSFVFKPRIEDVLKWK